MDKKGKTAKLCDFGEAKTIAQNTMTGNVGTLLYMSPEIIQNKVYDQKCDVYSFAVILYEVFFEVEPYNSRYEDSRHGNLFNLSHQILNGRRPVIPNNIEFVYSEQEKRYLELMSQCWEAEGHLRPSFEQVCEKLEQIKIIKINI